MLSAADTAKYFLQKDTSRKHFSGIPAKQDESSSYEESIRLNAYLHLAQNIHIAKTGEKLFEDPLYAYDNGGVVLDVQRNYSELSGCKEKPDIPADKCDFLDKFYKVFENTPSAELIEISREDPEWQSKHQRHTKQERQMNSLSQANEYRKQYADVLKVMERITV